MTEILDLEALLRGTVIGIGTGLVVAAIAHWMLKIPYGASILFAMGVALIVAVLLFYLWPSLANVPDINNLSLAEAEQSLSNKGLIPQSLPQSDSNTKQGYVVPHSQNPLPNTMVKKGTVISFAIGVGNIDRKKVKIFKPSNAEEVNLIHMDDGAYHFSVQGTSSLSQEEQLLLWARPSNVLHWYLQRSPNGIREIRPDGSWNGFGQIGNVNWPPKSGDTFDVAITVVDSQTARELLSAPGEAIQQALPGTSFDEVTGVKINKLH